ncbi:CDK5RAP1-like protein [Anthonomus grandis grandis]|uniref:CDK5RAP1-like protein n=1 Tax=Anthonomus grandis grandis TaxID=2921223 RepID=UPI00216632AC|nr:CDK5RAP1-like protein [Anthonomus grandis grandis]
MNLNRGLRTSMFSLGRSALRRPVVNCSICLKNINLSCNNTPETASKPQDQKTLKFRNKLLNGPNLKDFFKDTHLKHQDHLPEEQVAPYLVQSVPYGGQRKVYFDVYGCQMNVNDTEVIWAILKEHGFEKTNHIRNADVILIVTCAIRDSAEEKIWNKLNFIKGLKGKRRKNMPTLKVGILGCMAERLKEKVLETDQTVDLVVGPDAYRDLPRLLALTENNQKSVNVLLSFDETYADITPVRLNENSVSAFISIMRGCDNMCTYCIVPFTRGRERSRPVTSILREVEHLSEQGVKEVTLLGQNVNSYRDLSESNQGDNLTSLAKGFKTVYKLKKGGLRFGDLLYKVAQVNPEMRIRFTSPHPKDFPDEVIEMIRSHPNICKSLHMPAQSGNTAVLERMRRGYSREAYLQLVKHVRNRIPEVSLSSDFIAGFCGETDEEFEDTLSLMEEVKYNTAFLFPYSMREKTTAHRRLIDDVCDKVKNERLQKMIEVFRRNAYVLNAGQIGKIHLVLIEGFSKRSENNLQGRNDNNIKVIIPANDLVPSRDGTNSKLLSPGDYVAVHINAANSQVLKGIPLYYTGLQDFFQQNPSHFLDNHQLSMEYHQ